jgi:putative intracellular protease/amidase
MLLAKRNGSATGTVLIPVASEFHEGTIVYFLEHLREAGISVSLVSLSNRLIRGYHGMVIKADFSLGQIPLHSDHKLLILPGGKACASALLADPRIHQLIDETLDNRGLVAAMPEMEVMLEQSNLISGSREKTWPPLPTS